MNDYRRIPPNQGLQDPLANTVDALLADIAINVQLPPGKHATAVDRNKSIQEYLQRAGSPFERLIVQFYPQGSMAIDATISTRGTDNEYDLDGVIEIDVPPDTPPSAVLDVLYSVLKDYPVSKVVRQTRCVTLYYADGMHIDITPSRRTAPKPFESVIFHAHPDEPAHRHAHVPMNAYAFAAWYNRQAPLEERFSTAYYSRLNETYRMLAQDDAVVHEVPEQVPFTLKSVTTVALQLLKRFRDIWSMDRPGRYPPSVMLSCHAGFAAVPGMGLAEMVIRQARWTAREIDKASRVGKLLDVRNPEMYEDRFTDRWPENQDQQRTFAAALHDLANGLERLRNGDFELEVMQDWLRHCFGSLVVSRSFRALNQRNGLAVRSGSQRYTRTGGLYVPAAPAIVAGTTSALSGISPRSHTNMGDWRP